MSFLLDAAPIERRIPGVGASLEDTCRQGKTLAQALIREASEEVNVARVTYRVVALIADPVMAGMGHFDPFPRPGPNGRCRFGEETCAGVRGNGRDAP